MSDNRSPPPKPEACLERLRSSSQKGGTLIAESVTDLDEHRRRLCDPDGYRPAECPTCLGGCLHMHDRRGRTMLGDPQTPGITIAVYRCAGCGAIWRILPSFIARRLWRSWRVVEAVLIADPPSPSQPRVSERTQRRWWQRLRSSARGLVQWFSSGGTALLEAVAHAAGIDAAREELLAAYVAVIGPKPGSLMASFAALIHRLAPGVRLM